MKRINLWGAFVRKAWKGIRTWHADSWSQEENYDIIQQVKNVTCHRTQKANKVYILPWFFFLAALATGNSKIYRGTPWKDKGCSWLLFENKAVVLLKSVTCKRASEPCVLHLLQVYDVSLVAVTVLDSFVQALFSKQFNLSGHSEDWPW